MGSAPPPGSSRAQPAWSAAACGGAAVLSGRRRRPGVEGPVPVGRAPAGTGRSRAVRPTGGRRSAPARSDRRTPQRRAAPVCARRARGEPPRCRNASDGARSARGYPAPVATPVGADPAVLATAHDMAREHRVVSALGPTAVPVPRTLHLCTDPAVLGAPFYVMERVVGLHVSRELPAGYADQPAQRRAVADGLVDVLADLHAVDPAAVGLA